MSHAAQDFKVVITDYTGLAAHDLPRIKISRVHGWINVNILIGIRIKGIKILVMCYSKNFIIPPKKPAYFMLLSVRELHVDSLSPKLFSNRTKWCLVSLKKYVYFGFFNISIIFHLGVYTSSRPLHVKASSSRRHFGSCCLFSDPSVVCRYTLYIL